MLSKMTAILIVFFCALLGAIGQVFFKLAANDLKFDLLSILSNWKLILGLFLYGIATILFIITLKQQNLSLLYPIIASSYIWVTLFSVYILHEAFPVFKWLGILMILGGITVVIL